MYINKTLIYISSLLILSAILIPDSLNAQEETFQNPEVRIVDIDINNKVYSPNDEVKGTFVLKNTREYDTGNIYYSVVLLGSDDENTSNFKRLYELSEPVGPFFVPANSEISVEFSFSMLSYKPEEYLGLRFDAFLETGFRLSKSEVHLKTDGEVLPQLTVLNPTVTVGGNTINITQKPIIYKNEKASFKYVLENPLDVSVKIEPQITIRETGDLNNVVAKYNDQPLQVFANNQATVINSIRTFENTPGTYLARIDFIDEGGNKRSTPLIFTYIVDGDIATIESIISDSGYKLVRGEEFNVTLLYKGKPYDIRGAGDAQLVRDVSIFVEVLNLKGETVAKNTIQMDLESRGNIDVPMKAEIDTNGLKIDVRISKDGELLDESFLEIPDQSEGFSLPGYIYTILSIVALGIVGYVVSLKIKSRDVVVSLIFLFALFGFANSASALTTVYTVGDPVYIPTNITSSYNGGTLESAYQIGEGVNVNISFDIVEPSGGTQTENRGFSEWGGDCSNGGCTGSEMIYWTDTTSSTYLSAGTCLADDNCDESNLNYWIQGDYGDESTDCDVNGCQYTESFSLLGPDEEGIFRAYFYIRNEQTVGNQEYVGAALVYEDFEFYDPYSYLYTEGYCSWSYVDVSIPYTYGDDILVGEEILWSLIPSIGEVDGTLGEVTLSPYTFDETTGDILLFWEGDVGDSPTTLLDGPSSWVPGDLWWWFESEASASQTCVEMGYARVDYAGGGCIEEIVEEVCYEDGTGTIICDYISNERFVPITGADWTWGHDFTTTYSTSTLPIDGTVDVTLRYRKDPQYEPYYSSYTGGAESWTDTSSDSYGTLNCIIAEAGQDVCGNLGGIQSSVPAGYAVYPLVSEVGINGVTYADLNCYPVSLAREGTVTLTSTPSLVDMTESVSWVYSLSSDFFSGVLDGITFTIPRFATVTWSGDITNSNYLSGNSGTSESDVTFSDPDLLDVDEDISVVYTNVGTPSVTVTIEDSYLTTTSTTFVTVDPVVCRFECDPCLTEDVCDNGVSGDESVVESFTINPAIVNEGDQCTLTWATNDLTYDCNLNTPLGDINVATSSAGYLVDPGQYSLTCVNYAPEETIEGPLSCILNPNLKEN